MMERIDKIREGVNDEIRTLKRLRYKMSEHSRSDIDICIENLERLMK